MTRRASGVALALGLALATWTAAAQAQPARVVIAFAPAVAGDPASPLEQLARQHRLRAIGLLDATEGAYSQQQALLDVTQGARVTEGSYSPLARPALAVTAQAGVDGWEAARRRAHSAPATIVPGLLAASIPGGAAYAAAGAPGLDGVVAADRAGRLGAISLGSPATLAARVSTLLNRFRLVVVDLPRLAQLDALLATSGPHELVLVVQTPPPTLPAQGTAPQLLAIGAAGLGRDGMLSADTTRLTGLTTALDIGPTVLAWLRLRPPPAFKGVVMHVAGRRDAARLDRLARRLGAIEGRRAPAIQAFLLAWLALVAAAAAVRERAGARWARRVGATAALWTPVTVLLGAALQPSRAAELALAIGGALVLAAASDRLAPWPRAPLLAGGATLAIYAIDLARGSPLIVRSLLGSNPIFGSRFYGIGNELEAALPIVVLVAVAAGLPARVPRRTQALTIAICGGALTAIVAWGRLGADVGALFTIGGATAAATVLVLPQASWRARAIALGTPFAGLALLALVDLLSGAGGHFTKTVLHAGSASDLLDTVRRKLSEAFSGLRRGLMPLDVAVCLLGGLYAVRRRGQLLAPVAGAPAWEACLAGAWIGVIAGSLTNDSGPLLLVIGTFGLACAIVYLRSGPLSVAAGPAHAGAGAVRADGGNDRDAARAASSLSR